MRVVERHWKHQDWPSCQFDKGNMLEGTHVDDRVEVSETIT